MVGGDQSLRAPGCVVQEETLLDPDLHIVLVNPQIPWNTGNAGRTCLAFGARLHIVHPIAFSMDHRQARRAGLDYWESVDLVQHPSWEDFSAQMDHLGSPWLLTKHADEPLWNADLESPSVLVFGSETEGVPKSIHDQLAGRRVCIPLEAESSVRSLNLSSAVAMASYEFRRRFPVIGSVRA